MQEFVFETSHRIYFSTENPVPVGEIAKSLLALEKIITSSGTAFEGIASVEIDKIEVLISKLESGSVLQEIAIKFFFKDQAGLDAFIQKVRSKTWENGMAGKALVISAVLAALIGTGALYAALEAKNGGQTTITANNNVIINIGAGEVDLTPDALKAIVFAATKDKKSLAENAVQFFGPARGDQKSSITFDNNESIKFSPDVITATPSKVKMSKPEYSKDYSDVDLEIRATDLDNLKRGWAGVITGLIDKRIPLKLAENIKPEDLNRFRVRADITVFYKLLSKGSGSEMVPDHVLVRNIIK